MVLLIFGIFVASGPELRGRDDFEAWNITGRAVVLPSDDRGNSVARFQAGALINPMLRVSHDAVAIAGWPGLQPHERLRIRPISLARESTAGSAVDRTVVEFDFVPHGVAGEECQA